MLPEVVQIADPSHVVKLADFVLDEVRWRVQNETLGHRGRKITKWRHQIAAWHQARYTNGPTEAVDNLTEHYAASTHAEIRRATYAGVFRDGPPEPKAQ